MTNYSYGILDNQIRGFIDEKHRFGYRYSNQESMLRSFLNFLEDNTLTPVVSESSVMSWLETCDNPENRNYRISLLRQFALYLNRIGETAYVIPTTYHSLVHKNFCPYIYSKKELAMLFGVADNYGKFGRTPFSERSFPLILRMLYGCGLRISEALSLKYKHVDLVDGILIIKDTKFFKDRQVPMHKNLTKRCCEYFEKNIILLSPNDYFFPSGKNKRISNDTYYRYFRALLDLSGIRPKNACGKGPRIHDLRHTFAVHNLKQLDEAGYDMNTVLPILATYMGHTTYVGTGAYLHLTSELYPQIIDTVEKTYVDLLPQGGFEYE